MASLLRELTMYVENRTGLVIGTELFAGHIPADSPDDAVVIVEVGGPPSLPRLRGNVGEYGFQIIVRAEPKLFTEAKTRAELVYAQLGDLPGADLGEWEACVIEADSAPQFMEWDEHQRAVFVNTYTVRAYHKIDWWSV